MNEDLPQNSTDQSAPFLFLEMKDEDNDPTAPGTVFTGERLLANHPETYRQIVHMLGQGVGIREIKRRLGVHHRTIQAVSIREGTTIDTLRRELGARALGVAGLALEALEDRIVSGGVKPGELAMAIGILVDKGQILTGGVTGRVEKIERHQVEKDIDAMLCEVEDVSDSDLTGLSVENFALIEGSTGSADDVADLVGSAVATARLDSISDVSLCSSKVNSYSATGSATDCLVEMPVLKPSDELQPEGAGGVCLGGGGAGNHIVSDPAKLCQ